MPLGARNCNNMTDDQFKRAGVLKNRIKELEELVFVISPYKVKTPFASGKISLECFIKTSKSFTAFGKRNFGCGSHTEIASIPEDLIDKFADFVLEEKTKLEIELCSL